MEENVKKNSQEIEIDLQQLLQSLLSRAWLICVVAVLCAAIAFGWTLFFVTPQYESSVMFYVNNSNIDLSSANLSLSAADISASRGLVDVYIVILKTREAMLDDLDYADVKMSPEQLMGMVSAQSVNQTEVFRVTVTHPDPAIAEKLADAITYILPKRISNIVEGTSAKIVDTAVMPSVPCSPSYTKNTILGFAIGALLAVLLVVIRELMNIEIRSEEDIAQVCKYPILAAVPDMEMNTKGGYYGYGQKSQRQNPGKDGGKNRFIGTNVSFAAAESYKLLRTKLQFSFADEKACRIIGVSSALSGEGKSISAMNLSYALSQLDKRILLIDCDLRRPTVAERLGVSSTPGLSDYLSGQASADALIQFCGIKGAEKAFHVIASGHTPPNPMELLSSPRMKRTLEILREKYDYIILDLPPVGEVSDALVAAKLADGMLLVARQNYCDRVVLNDAVRQFEFVDSKILGVVLNGTNEENGAYRKKYSKYYKKHYYGYYKRTENGGKQKKK